MTAPFRVHPLDPEIDRSGFTCGSEPLDRYFRQQVKQDIKRRVAACFVATNGQGEVAGYYTLASASIALTDLPTELSRKLPRYPTVPAVRMGRLAVSQQFKKKGLGAALLADALRKASTAEIAAYALIVDAKDAEIASFYIRHGFIAFAEQPLTLFLSLATVGPLLKQQKSLPLHNS